MLLKGISINSTDIPPEKRINPILKLSQEKTNCKIQQREKTLQIIVGYCCNNNCIFCMEDRQERSKRKNIPIDFYKTIILESAKKFRRIVFSLGEPTLNKYLPELISYAKELHYPEIALITNGRRLSYQKFSVALAEKGLNNIGVSLHGHNKDLHESLTRTPSSFDQTCKGLSNIQKLREKGKIKHFTIHITINKLNYKYLNKIYDFAMKFNPNKMIFNMFNPKDAAKKKFDMLMPKYLDVIKIFRKMYLEKKRNFVLIDFPPCTIKGMFSQLGCIEDYHIRNEDLQNLNNSGTSYYKRESLKGKVKLSKCESCHLNAFCCGVSNIYIERLGDREFQPIT